MNLAGTLCEVSIEDLLVFLRRGKRTGTLALRQGEQKASITLRSGKPISVRMPGTPRLGDLLLASGLSDPITVREAARVQAEEETRRPLGQILVAHGAIDRDRLARLIQKQLDLAMTRLLDWARDGDYTFFTGEPVHDGDLCLELGETRRTNNRWAMQLQNDREILLAIAEATLEDERGDSGLETRSSEPPGPRVLVVSQDRILCGQLAAALPERLGGLRRLRPEAARGKKADLDRQGAPPVVVMDLRDGGATTSDLAALHRRRPAMPIVAILGPGETPNSAFASGALATAPAEVLALTSCIENAAALADTLLKGRVSQPIPEQVPAEPPQAPLPLPPVAALSLMQSIANVAERAILFALTPEGLQSAGAFGTSSKGLPLAEATRGLCLKLAASGALGQCLEDGQPRRLQLTHGAMPAALAECIGMPAHQECAVVPVADEEGKVNSVLYSDNGGLDAPLGRLNAFDKVTELAAGQEFPTEPIAARSA